MSFLNFDDIHYFSLAGFTLNAEERAALSSSLVLLRQHERLSSTSLWGKVLGIQKDYFVAQGITDDLFARKYFYSMDMVNWLQLPQLAPPELMRSENILSRFLGDPSFEYAVTETTPEDAEKPPVINEEKRLAGLVALINHEAQVVPRGAYYRDALHELKSNPSFQGLPGSDAGFLTSYQHFRPGFKLDLKTVKDLGANYDESIDIFDPISKDQPNGVWSLQQEQGGEVILLRSLLWPGYTFFHTPTPSKFGSMYCGNGQKNANIGFML
ncbi:hypothetical protein SmJEL517_g05994 [Synchytrium microbalum]|uniref:Radial spoke head protein 9 homolog n=1 Tax=Synchytrium microbalum TaxID=1806994 RepID=A0A507BI20_9FUNG|nr:uncharacterized protein SmJEL517_g05994 [Synchytrium microbalum]TPX30440.1 hypothetical protein SmJEL517_g05994 [Synchytrium microbalum]